MMKSIATICVATAVTFGIGQSIAKADEIAVSLVHPKGRVDIPIGALDHVQAYATSKFRHPETGAPFHDPQVEVCVTEEFKERICNLTKNIVGEAMAIVVDCETVTEPIVREPLCTRRCFAISIFDLEEANVLAQRIRGGSNRACAPTN
jgi:hypothetical protein